MDVFLFRYLNSLAGVSSFVDQVIIFLADNFSILVILSAGVFLFWHQETRKGDHAWLNFTRKSREILLVFIVSLASWCLATLLKELFQNPRPYDALTGVIKLFNPNDPFSLPSGHATFFSALATSLYFYHKRIGYLFAFFALIIGLARVASGIHYPSDILTGFGVGIIVAGIVAYFRKKV